MGALQKNGSGWSPKQAALNKGANTMAKQIVNISSADILDIINTVSAGEFVSLMFTRVAPKCQHCGKSNKKWIGETHCPECGGELSLERFTMAQFGIHNPSNCSAPKGTGESNKQANAKGRLKFFDMNAKNPDGSKGCYRQCHIDLIKRMTVKGVEYIVK